MKKIVSICIVFILAILCVDFFTFTTLATEMHRMFPAVVSVPENWTSPSVLVLMGPEIPGSNLGKGDSTLLLDVGVDFFGSQTATRDLPEPTSTPAEHLDEIKESTLPESTNETENIEEKDEYAIENDRISGSIIFGISLVIILGGAWLLIWRKKKISPYR